MERITQKTAEGYTASDLELAINRLGRLEDMYEALCAELARTVSQIERLTAEGKGKTVTYRQLFVNKLNLMNLKSRFDIYGIFETDF